MPDESPAHLDPNKANYAFFYVWLVEQFARFARTKGWCLAVHGSMRRDLDIIAVPWTEDAISSAEFIAAMSEECNAPVIGKMGIKPHGRRAWMFTLGGHPYVDMSIMDFRECGVESPMTTPNPVVTDPECKCPFCGGPVKSAMIKQLKAKGVALTDSEFAIISRLDELEREFFHAKQILGMVPTKPVMVRVGFSRQSPSGGVMVGSMWFEGVDRGDAYYIARVAEKHGEVQDIKIERHVDPPCADPNPCQPPDPSGPFIVG